MLKTVLSLATALVISPLAQAEPIDVVQFSQPLIQAVAVQGQIAQSSGVTALALKWKVGDKANYSISVGGFINGTSDSFVRDVMTDEIWVQQNMDLGIAGKQKVEILFDRATGQVKKLLANGQEQAIPDASGIEIVETKEDRVTVPAGTFDAIYAKIRNKSDGKIQEAWINPQEVPINGVVKALGETPMGKMTQELTLKAFAP